MNDDGGGPPSYHLTAGARLVLAALAVECGAVAWSLWARPPAQTGRTSTTVLDIIPVLGVLWPWLFLAGAGALLVVAGTGWSRWLHVILSVGGGVHVSYALASLAVSIVNATGWTLAAVASSTGLFYMLTAVWVHRGAR